VALELALAGEAIALVNGPFVERELASGQLVRPVAHTSVCPGAWGLICRAELKDSPRIANFLAWMTSGLPPQGASADAASATRAL
jgi:LysR family glycine cleavage system transcriptional activator